MKIIKHGCTFKDTPVFYCSNCDLIAILDRKSLTKKTIICPECFEEGEISFADKEEIKEIKASAKESSNG